MKPHIREDLHAISAERAGDDVPKKKEDFIKIVPLCSERDSLMKFLDSMEMPGKLS